MNTNGIDPQNDDELTPHSYDPTAPLVPTGNLRRRKLVSRLVELSATGAAVLAVVVLAIVVAGVVKNGAPALNLDFITKNPPAFGGSSGGIAPAIAGTALVVGMATLIAMPMGVLIAVYLTEYASASRFSGIVRMSLDLINGLPSIVIGLFVFGLLVVGHAQSAFAGAVALAIIMLPLVARGSQEVLLLVPNQLREAADALGVSRFRSVTGVILPAAMGGILTSTVLAVARAAGETAPLILVCSIYNNNLHVDPSHAVATIPVAIFQLSESADPAGYARAWGAGLVLLAFIMIASLAGRAALARSRRKLTQ